MNITFAGIAIAFALFMGLSHIATGIARGEAIRSGMTAQQYGAWMYAADALNKP